VGDRIWGSCWGWIQELIIMRKVIPHNSLILPGVSVPTLWAWLALLAVALNGAWVVRAQDSITVKNPAEYNAYHNCSKHSDPEMKSSCLEGFLHAFPQSLLRNDVLEQLLNIYYNPAPQGTGDSDKAFNTASRLLQMDPNNLVAILYSVLIKKGQCAKSQDVQTCNAAASFAYKGLLAHKPDGVAVSEWKSQTDFAYPIFHSAIAYDDAAVKKDYNAAISEYTQELTLYTDQQTQTTGLMDTYLLAQAYTQPSAKNLAYAVWFFARVWNFVPAQNKASIERPLEYWYTKYHGNLGGLEQIKANAALTTFPPGSFTASAANAHQRSASASKATHQIHKGSMWTILNNPALVINNWNIPDQPSDTSETDTEQIPNIADTASDTNAERLKTDSPVAATVNFPTIPVPVLPAAPAESSAPVFPMNDKPAPAAVTWDSQGLRIDASNSSLQQIMKDVSTATGTQVEGLDTDQRVFGAYGPGPARDVLGQLLHGSGYNVLMIGDQGQGTPRRIVLSAPHAGTATAATPAAQENDEDTEPEEPQPQPQGPPNRPGFPGGMPQRMPQRMPPGQPGQPQPGQPNSPQN
jgi:tetratricopeptide (TPR) repeat protein